MKSLRHRHSLVPTSFREQCFSRRTSPPQRSQRYTEVPTLSHTISLPKKKMAGPAPVGEESAHLSDLCSEFSLRRCHVVRPGRIVAQGPVEAGAVLASFVSPLFVLEGDDGAKFAEQLGTPLYDLVEEYSAAVFFAVDGVAVCEAVWGLLGLGGAKRRLREKIHSLLQSTSEERWFCWAAYEGSNCGGGLAEATSSAGASLAGVEVPPESSSALLALEHGETTGADHEKPLIVNQRPPTAFGDHVTLRRMIFEFAERFQRLLSEAGGFSSVRSFSVAEIAGMFEVVLATQPFEQIEMGLAPHSRQRFVQPCNDPLALSESRNAFFSPINLLFEHAGTKGVAAAPESSLQQQSSGSDEDNVKTNKQPNCFLAETAGMRMASEKRHRSDPVGSERWSFGGSRVVPLSSLTVRALTPIADGEPLTIDLRAAFPKAYVARVFACPECSSSHVELHSNATSLLCQRCWKKSSSSESDVDVLQELHPSYLLAEAQYMEQCADDGVDVAVFDPPRPMSTQHTLVFHAVWHLIHGQAFSLPNRCSPRRDALVNFLSDALELIVLCLGRFSSAPAPPRASSAPRRCCSTGHAGVLVASYVVRQRSRIPVWRRRSSRICKMSRQKPRHRSAQQLAVAFRPTGFRQLSKPSAVSSIFRVSRRSRRRIRNGGAGSFGFAAYLSGLRTRDRAKILPRRSRASGGGGRRNSSPTKPSVWRRR